MTQWRNRIVGEGEEAPDQLLAHDKNWRIHPKAQQDALGAVLDEVGFVQRVIVNQRTGKVVDGHLRVAMAISKEQKTVPVIYVDLSENEENLILSTIDPLSALAATDRDKLDELLRDVQTGSPELQELLTTIAEKAGIVPVTEDDPSDHWKGMPEFHNEPKAHRTMFVHFKTQDDVEDFAKLIGQNIGENTKYIWHPEQERRDLTRVAFVSEK